MKALEIIINGKRRATIGNPEMETLDFAFRYFSDGSASFVSHALLETDEMEPVCEYWPEIAVADPKEIEIRIIEVPSLEEVDRSFPGTHRITAGGGLETACSICGKTHEEVKKLIFGQTGNVCDECVDFCYELMVHDGVLPHNEP